MVVLLNGAFGVGKTTVARLLRRRLPSGLLFDPERIGYVLRRLPRWLPLDGLRRDDYQHCPMWRRLTVRGIRVGRLVRSNVVVPMAFSEVSYLREIRAGIARFDEDIMHLCLVAPLEVVHQRLRSRGEDPASPGGAWAFRRASECCEAHAAPEFAEQVPTAGRTPEAIVGDLLRRIGARQDTANTASP